MATVLGVFNYATRSEVSPAVFCQSEPHPRRKEARQTVPRIIHQTWPTTRVPKKLIKWIRTWAGRNPAWEYWFWTDADIRTLLSVRYPGYVSLFDGYDVHVKRADAMRYFVLREFGGVYVDVDMECLSPLDRWVHRFRCFLCEENYEHQSLIYHRKDPIIITSIMGCVGRHPFYGDLVRALPASADVADVLNATGPFFVTRVFEEFSRKGQAIDDYVTVLPPRFLSPVADPAQRHFFLRHCLRMMNASGRRLYEATAEEEPPRPDERGGWPTAEEKRPLFKPSYDAGQENRELDICAVLAKNNFTSSADSQSLAVHHWIHTMLNETRWMHQEETAFIKDIVNNVIFYTDLLNKTSTSNYFTDV